MSIDPGAPTPYAVTGWPYAQSRTTPGTVIAVVAVTVTSVLLVALSSLLLFALAMTLGGPLFEAFDKGTDPRWYLAAVELVLLAWSAVAGLLAWKVLRRRGWARVGLAVSCALTLVVSVVAVSSIVAIATFLAAIAVLVLLFLPSTNAWFRQDGAS